LIELQTLTAAIGDVCETSVWAMHRPVMGSEGTVAISLKVTKHEI